MKTVPASDLDGFRAEQATAWRQTRILIPDSARLYSLEGMFFFEVYNSPETGFGDRDRWFVLSGCEAMDDGSVKVFVRMGNPRHRHNCLRTSFFVTPDTDIRVRTRATL